MNSLVFRSLVSVIVLFCSLSSVGQSKQLEFYELRVYNYTDEGSASRLDKYLKDALVPALHRGGIKQVGVFKLRDTDTSSIRKTYVLIPYRSLDEFDKISTTLEKDKKYLAAGSDYINASHDNPPYQRIEKMILKAFTGMPHLQQPKLTGDKKSRVYELRSYESPTEKLYRTKVKMFNVGDEVGIFNRLGFNAIFYAEVLAGKKMPNLMYMTSFESMEERDAHWKAFGSDPEWEKLKADKQYDNTVSHIDITFLYPAEYSDL